MVIITKDIAGELASYLSSHRHDKTYVVTDANTREKCLPMLENVQAVKDATCIAIEAGDTNKNIQQVEHIWMTLSQAARRAIRC